MTVMTRLIFSAVLVATVCVPFIAAMSSNEASAQQRETCSEARLHCGTQRVCQRRYDACIETGCWTVGLIKRCGYKKE
jgi:hypothetical protein